ncbi:hypothetical protein AgCh_021546 [Apium graveolens]
MINSKHSSTLFSTTDDSTQTTEITTETIAATSIAQQIGNLMFSSTDGSTPPPLFGQDGLWTDDYIHWFHQDQLIMSSLLGSLSAEVMPLVAVANTSQKGLRLKAQDLCKMVNKTEVPKTVETGSGYGGTVSIDWTTYHFPQPIDLSGMPDKFSGGVSFSRWQKKMKLWLTVKGLWPVVPYDPPVLDQEKAESVKAYALWAEKDGVARVDILAALENTLFDVYSSDAYTAKVLWDKPDQTHNTDSQGLEKYSVARFFDFKLVDGKFMTEQVHQFEMLVHALGESDMVLPKKFRVMFVIEKLPKS